MRLPQNISRTIDAVARSALGKDWSLYATILDHWPEIVGVDYAKDTTPVKIVFPKGKKKDEKWAQGNRTGGILTIRLPQGLTFTFSHNTEQIKTRINNFFGYEAIGKIAFESFYPSPKAEKAAPPPLTDLEKDTLQSHIKNIDNNELRDALERLGASVLANQKRV